MPEEAPVTDTGAVESLFDKGPLPSAEATQEGAKLASTEQELEKGVETPPVEAPKVEPLTEPKPEVKPTEGEFRSDLFDEVTGEVTKEEPKPKVEEPEVTKVEEPKVEVPPPVSKEDLVAQEKVEFGDVWAAHFSNMSNQAREYTKARIREAKASTEEVATLKQQIQEAPKTIPANWFEHNEAYTILPEYKQTNALLNDFQYIVEHYQKQLPKIRNGEEWVDIVTDEQGAMRQVARQPEESDEALLSSRITRGSLQVAQIQQKLQGFRDNYATLARSAKTNMQEIEHKHFPEYVAEDSLKDNKHYNNMVSTLRGRNLQDNILANYLSKLYARAKLSEEKIAELTAKKEADAVVQRAVESSGPSSAVLTKGGVVEELPLEKQPFLGAEFDEVAG